MEQSIITHAGSVVLGDSIIMKRLIGQICLPLFVTVHAGQTSVYWHAGQDGEANVAAGPYHHRWTLSNRGEFFLNGHSLSGTRSG